MSMTRDELLAKLNSVEWNDIEFKAAACQVPKSAMTTVSAFANTAGGHIVFGVQELNGKFVVSGVTDADRVQNTFLGWLRDSNKISVFLPVTGQPMLAQGQIGVRLTAAEANVFAYLARMGQVTLVDVKGLTGLNGPDALKLMQRLTVQALADVPEPGGDIYHLAQPFRDRFLPGAAVATQKNQGLTETSTTVQATVQAGSEQADGSLALVHLTAVQRVIVDLAVTPRTVGALQGATGLKQRANFVALHLNPLIAGRILRRTIPDKPTSPKQQYVLTEIGLRLKALQSQSPASTEIQHPKK